MRLRRNCVARTFDVISWNALNGVRGFYWLVSHGFDCVQEALSLEIHVFSRLFAMFCFLGRASYFPLNQYRRWLYMYILAQTACNCVRVRVGVVMDADSDSNVDV